VDQVVVEPIMQLYQTPLELEPLVREILVEMVLETMVVVVAVEQPQ
tara:strand:+ start:260 stop:397 length:138 start_codon:yes stop_codon:yes gene_type:complete